MIRVFGTSGHVHRWGYGFHYAFFAFGRCGDTFLAFSRVIISRDRLCVVWDDASEGGRMSIGKVDHAQQSTECSDHTATTNDRSSNQYYCTLTNHPEIHSPISYKKRSTETSKNERNLDRPITFRTRHLHTSSSSPLLRLVIDVPRLLST